MSDQAKPEQSLIAELKVSAHLMTLDAGVYCVYSPAGSEVPDPTTGLPAVRLTVPPGLLGRNTTITSVRDDGWMGAQDAVSLIRVPRGPAQVLITIYQLPGSAQEAPALQVTKLVDGVAAQAVPGPQAVAAPQPASGEDTVPGTQDTSQGEPEIVAHVQLRGDVKARLGDWIGEPGSQRWIEGFSLAPQATVASEEIEYQAVLGRGWLSPWAEGGQYCGSRGMALPILGLRVRLRGDAASQYDVSLRATFTDGTSVGPVAQGEACEAESLAPLEAFQLVVQGAGEAVAGSAVPRAAVVAPIVAKARAGRTAAKPAPVPEPKPPARAAKAAPAKAAPVKAVAAKAAPAKAPPAKAAASRAAPAKTAAPAKPVKKLPPPAKPKSRLVPVRGKGR